MGTSISVSQRAGFLDGLNREQAVAVQVDPSIHTLVLAGAGCGKTTVLTRRIAYLQSIGYPQENILALTFTRKAADEMQSRVFGSGQEKTSDSALITTFHGFALRILTDTIDGQKNFSRIEFTENGRLIEENERKTLLAKVSTRDERRELGLDIIELDSLIARFEVFPGKIAGFDDTRLTLLKNISERLISARQAEGLWDFSDLLCGCLRLFNKFPEVNILYKQRYRAILVDEFQDTNPVQIELLRMLLGNGTGVFAVGDDDQAIYGFRGADIGPTINFRNVFNNAQIVKLQTNYRSCTTILAFANRIFRHKDPQYRKVLVCGRKDYLKERGSLLRRIFTDQKNMLEWVEKEAKRISTAYTIPIESMAMLCRVNQSIDLVTKLAQKDFPALLAMQMMTIHKSKGLEFPAVFLCDLEEGEFPSYQMHDNKEIRSLVEFVTELFRKRKRIDCDFDEEKRLFYVGVTRAQKYLCLLSVNSKILYGRTRRFERSRFFRMR